MPPPDTVHNDDVESKPDGDTMTTSDKVVLVTGINGYIATHIGLQLLQKGYKVRGTSRSDSAREHLVAGAFHAYASQYEHVQVPDITAPGAFDAAVRGVHAIIHTASPVDFTLQTVDAFFGPAIGGNLSVLESARTAAGPQLQAVVVTSSIAAIVDRWRLPADHAYTEADWNETAESVARADFTAPVAYGASKSAAEKALWEWTATNSPSFAVAAINPAVVTGPPVSWPPRPEGLNTTLLPIWNIYSGATGPANMPPQIGGAGYIDVRDVARMHVWAAEHPAQSNGQRYILSNGKAPPQAAADLLRKTFPERDIIVGEPGKGYTPDYWFVAGEASTVATKAYQALGVERFIPYDQSILDTVAAFEDHWPGLARNFKPKN
jgi:nucleoside-diphosphate-sugar epimerase